MIELIFNENHNASKPRLAILGFSSSYREMLCTVLGADFNICERDPEIIIADEGVAVSKKPVPVIVLGKLEEKRKNRIFLRRPVELERLRKTALALIPREELAEKKSLEIIVNEKNQSVSYGGKTVALTKLEIALFSMLYSSAEPVSREDIRGTLWPESEDTNICDVYICYLRKKLEPLFGKGFIVSVRGKGYLLNLPQNGLGN